MLIMYRRFIGIKCTTLTVSYNGVRIGQKNSNPTLRVLVSRVPKQRRRRIALDNVGRQNGIEITFKSKAPGQIERLVEFLEQNPWIVKPVCRSRFIKMEKARKWRLLASILNAMGGVIKNERGWAKYWAEKKCALKRKWSILKEQAVSGIEECLNNTSDSDLSPLDKRLVVLLEGFKSHAKSTEQPKHSYNSISSAASTSTGADKQCSTQLSSDERMETRGQDTPSDKPKQCYPQLNLTLSSGQLDQFKGMRVTIATPTTTPDVSATVKGTNHTNKTTTINTKTPKRYIAKPLSKYQLSYNSDARINSIQEKQRKIDAKIKLADAIENVGRRMENVTTALKDVTTAINRIAAVLENRTQELL